MKCLTRVVVCTLLASLGANPSARAQTGTAAVYGEVSDPQLQVVPGALVTVTHVESGTTSATMTDDRGGYRFVGLRPGTYTIKVERTGFKTTTAVSVPLVVDTTTRHHLHLEIGDLTETVTVVGESARINTTDASLGNSFSRTQILSLPIEAQNVVQLLSLQPGAVFVPRMSSQSGGDPEDPRYGAVTGARADQQTVTLDGIDVNDPQNQTAYTSAIRVTQEALQEFRVSTANYGADMGRSSGPQVSLVTRSGTNQFDGSAYWTFRRTATSSNEYFLKLAQLGSGEPSTAPKLDKDIIGASAAGPIRSNRLFFFLNVEGLHEHSETPLVRAVPSNSFRDGVLMYQCASDAACPGGSVRGFRGTHSVPSGWYGMTPAQIAALDPLHVGPSLAASEYFRQYPEPNDPGRDTNNIAAYRFAAPIEDEFYTLLGRVDFNLTELGSHKLFGRFGKQDDTINDPPQFPGQRPRRQRVLNNYGLALGSDSVLSRTLVNSIRYGVTKIDEANQGVTNTNYVTFRFIDPIDAVGVTGEAGTFTNTREPLTYNLVDDLSWFRKSHVVKLGANLRFTRVPKERFQDSFLDASVNPSWVAGVGSRNMPGSAFCTEPVCATLPEVAENGQSGYADSWLNSLGVLSQSTLRANYDREGNPQAPGTPVARTMASNEYEVYLQDSWQMRPSLTLSAGLRYSLYSPPYEANGLQVAPTISMGEWFDQRVRNMQQGIPSNHSPIVSFDLAGPKNGRKGFYDWDKNNFAPRIAAAWSPTAERGFLRRLTGDGELVVRGGYSKAFDRVGYGLATNFDEGFSFGMSTTLSSPFGEPYEEDPAVRFRNPTTLPPTVPTAPAGGFPQTPPLRAGVITEIIDDTLVTPSAHVASVTIGRQFRRNFAFEGSYVGRFGRDVLVRRDLAMPLNLVDVRSGVNYFSAAQAAIGAAESHGIAGDSPTSTYSTLPAIAYWENLFPGAADDELTATQAVTRAFMANGPDWMTALYEMDTACIPACSVFGPYAYFSEQYDSLGAISSIGRSNYHAMLLTLRKRYADGFQFDINYTLSQSKDTASEVERGTAFGNFDNGGYSGFLINSFDPDSGYGISDFDVRHQINANWIADLPFGQGRRFARDAGGMLNQLIGNWSVAGLVRWTSAFPFNVYNCRSCWSTNWNLQGNAMLVDPTRLPPTETTRDIVNGRPSPFKNPTEALTFFRRALPGEAGIRNLLRGDGYFTIDTSISKAWSTGIADHRLRFRWDVFNVTNTPKFDVGQMQGYPDLANFGQYDGALATCDARAGRCMQFALRYEF